jgi:ankyrin repeat protein
MNKLKALFLAMLLTAAGAAAGEKMELLKALEDKADVKQVAELISKGADVNQADGKGFTPLMAALGRKTTDVAELLIAKGANVNAHSPQGYSPLMVAVFLGHPEMVKLLLDHGAGLNDKEKSGHNATHFAAAATMPGAPVGVEENPATPASRLAVLKLLLEKGGDPRVAASDGDPLLVEICPEVPIETIELLLDHGDDVNAKSAEGRTALMAAAKAGKANVVKLLLKKGAKRDVKDKNGKTALDYAKDKGDPDTLALLK